MKTKHCTKCKETKPLNEFSKNKKNKDGHRYWCKTCVKKWRSGHRNEINKYLREYRLTYRHGITLREYGLMLELQDGGCAICGAIPEENEKRLAVDHDHETGEVRELLCRNCNLALGLLDDDPERCEIAKMYLIKHGK